MHRKWRASSVRRDAGGTSRPRPSLLLLLTMLAAAFPGGRAIGENPYGIEPSPDFSRGCNQVTCRLGEQCVNRKFWCEHLPCPSMTYCSKSRKESLKGPESCESVTCTPGYQCLVQLQDCDWNQNCRQRVARCVTEWQFQESPANCADAICPRGHRCILRETHCFRPPCKLTRSCAREEDIEVWYETCKQLGCLSENDCFLRKPIENCAPALCYHTSACLAPIASEDEYCRGWICPAGEVCAVNVEANCRGGNCQLYRSCQRASPPTAFRALLEPIGIISSRVSLPDLERESFLNERSKHSIPPIPFANYTKVISSAQSFDGYVPSRYTLPYKNSDYSSVKTKRVTSIPGPPSVGSSWLNYLRRKAGAEAEAAAQHEGNVPLLQPSPAYRSYFVEPLARTDHRPSASNVDVRVAAASAPSGRAAVPDFRRNAHEPGLVATAVLGPPSVLGPPAILGPPSVLGPPATSYLQMSQRRGGVLDSSATSLDRRLSPSPAEEFAESVKNSWKSWQSYYAPNSPPALLPEPPSAYYTSNYNSVRENFSLSATPVLPANLFYPDGEPGFGTPVLDLQPPPELLSGLPPLDPSNIIKFESRQPGTKLLLSSPTANGDYQPNLILYFPQPLNFIIYYYNQHPNQSIDSNFEDSEDMEEISYRSFIGEEGHEDHHGLHDDEIPKKKDKFDKLKELAYIRKIIKELIEYWDKEEQVVKGLQKEKGDFPDRITASRSADASNSRETIAKPTFNKYLEWLANNNKSSDPGSKKEEPQSLNNEETKSIHIVVDIDKNPDLMKALLSRNVSDDKKNSGAKDQKIMVNLTDFVDPKEADVMSKKLIDIATNQLHKTFAGSDKLPKTLWVFPIYNKEENDTLVNELAKLKNKITNPFEGPRPPSAKNNYPQNAGKSHGNSSKRPASQERSRSAAARQRNLEPNDDEDAYDYGDDSNDSDYEYQGEDDYENEHPAHSEEKRT